MKNDNQKIYLIQILEEFINYCANNNLKYSLFAGSLLGAIRHGGIIPWDDDIDVIMNRDDYNYFINNYTPSSRRFSLLKPLDKNYFYPFAKLVLKDVKIKEKNRRGEMFLFIDIFPMDNYSNVAIKKTKHLRRMMVVKGQKKPIFPLYIKNKKVPFIHYLYYFAEWIISNMFSFAHLYKRLMIIISKNEGSYYGPIVWPSCEKALFLCNYFNKGVFLHPFESLNACIFKEYDELLKKLYGNYMVPPNPLPKETHDYEIIN